MSINSDNKNSTATFKQYKKSSIEHEDAKNGQIVLLFFVFLLIFMIFGIYTSFQRENVIRNAEQVTSQMADNVAENIANKIDYAKSSIRLVAVNVSQMMNSYILNKPGNVIPPMVNNTPFGNIEYIRPDGMNVMNIGEPFDASDRIYFVEGIKGNTGIWNNFHPKTSKETLMNFYTPLIYRGGISGVITGYIETSQQIATLFEKELYGEPIYGILLDGDDMVICSTMKHEFQNDMTFQMLMNQVDATDTQKRIIMDAIDNISDGVVSFMENDGEGRICVSTVPGTDWKTIVVVPAASFNEIVGDNTKSFVITIAVSIIILMLYAAYILIMTVKRRKEIAQENERLEKENQSINDENHRIFGEISEIRDIISSANMGTWKIELVEGEEPRMYVDDTMKMLLGISGSERTPQETYNDWFANVKPEAVQSVLDSVGKMQKGFFDENTYLWIHPVKGEIYVRCGGTAHEIPGGYQLRGYHYDVDDIVREDQAKVEMLRETLDEKNEYYSTLGAFADIFYSMHVINLAEDTVIEFSAKNNVGEIVNHTTGAAEMMRNIMKANITDEYLGEALEFTDLTTASERMKGRKVVSKEFLGKHIGWILAGFVTVESDDEGRPVKVIFTTRSIDDEKKQAEELVKKSQTDELTGLLNRRAYEDDMNRYRSTKGLNNFIYVSMDVNGLKVVNDSLGHAAGDELLTGACECMKKSFGAIGNIYRTGGDEFAAVLFCDVKTLTAALADFEEAMDNWEGEQIKNLSVSYGWICKEEKPEYSARELAVVAEERMYEAKSDHYRKTGVDRRGQIDAHKALCELYTKILKINISDDSYQIINMEQSEQVTDKGFSDKISVWLKNFGLSGQVHPDDLSDYLEKVDLQYIKDYFSGNKTSMHIFYRRNYNGVFKQVMMEMIPAIDYSVDNQSLYLYVKDIDR